MEIGERIKQLRLARGMSLEELGNLVGVGKSTVRKWEIGQIENMRRDKIAKLADALGTTPAQLMGWPESKKEEETYFLNKEVAEMAEEMKSNPEYRVLMKSAKDLSPNQLQAVKTLVESLVAKEK